jgi:hypothetical protein
MVKTPSFFAPHSPGSLDYLDGHLPRFKVGIEMLQSIDWTKIDSILELGSKAPFYAYPFNKPTTVMSIECNQEGTIDNFKFKYYNLNYEEPLGKWPLIIITEVWEHLPSNVLKVRNRVWDAIIPGGYLLTSFPLGGLNASLENYNKNWLDDFKTPVLGHLREFTKETSTQFLNQMPDLMLIHDETVYTHAYGNNIRVCLCQKKK